MGLVNINTQQRKRNNDDDLFGSMNVQTGVLLFQYGRTTARQQWYRCCVVAVGGSAFKPQIEREVKLFERLPYGCS